jgi:hypothetical protein
MQKLLCIFALTLISSGVLADFSCPNDTKPICLDTGDKVCPGTAKCVSNDVVCFDKKACDSERGFMCTSEYDDVLNDYEETVGQYNKLALENENLREKRLAKKNCVLNAPTLEEAKICVR